eukprot:5054447-Amphidinium_carterae.1
MESTASTEKKQKGKQSCCWSPRAFQTLLHLKSNANKVPKSTRKPPSRKEGFLHALRFSRAECGDTTGNDEQK